MDKIRKYFLYCAVTLIASLVSGCAHQSTPVFTSKTDIKRYAYLGLAQIKTGNYVAAQKYFAAGLREDPRNCVLNFFNGLSYQLEGQDGNIESRDLARVGYENAIRSCPTDPWPYFYNGILSYEQGDYFSAEKMFANANAVSGNDVTVFLTNYLYAAYRIGDVRAVKTILSRLRDINPNNPLIAKLNRTFQDIRTPKTNPFAENLKKKTPAINDKNGPKQVLIDGILILSRATASTNRGVNLLKGLTLQYGNSTTPGFLFTGNSILTGGMRNQAAAAVGGGASISASTLPFPSQLTNIISVPAVTYDMNIFNDADEKSEIVARPSITVEDNHQATYFSGTQLILGIEGTQTGTIEQVPLGVTMKLTPHFLPNGTIDLDIDMGREFLVQKSGSSFNSFSQAAQTLKEDTNTSVNLKYGQTIVLSTLYDTRRNETANSVPGLGNLPIIGYFFKNTTSTTVQTNLISLLTPVKYIAFPTQTAVPSQQALITYYETLLSESSQLPAVLDNLKAIEIYHVKTPITPSLSKEGDSPLEKAEHFEFDSMYGGALYQDNSTLPSPGPGPALPMPE